MYSKKALQTVREVIMFPGAPSDERTFVQRESKAVTKRKRDFSHIIGLIDTRMREVDPTLPASVSPMHFATLQKLAAIAFRDNKDEADTICPNCGEKVAVRILNAKLEKNSIDCAIRLADSMYPKLGHLTQEVNLVGQINLVSEYISDIVVKYVPVDQRNEAMAKISEMFERITANGQCNSSQTDAVPMLESAQG